MTETPVMEACSLNKAYVMTHGTVEVLRDYSLRVAAGETLCIMGASGSGKSTLLHLLAGLDSPDSGEIKVRGEPMTRWSESRRAAFRAKHIGVVFQHYYLMPDLTVLENALMPLRATTPWRGPDKKQIQMTVDRLDQVGLGDRLDHRPKELSGGEQQRLAVVRALVNDPDILLADEPTGNLDADTGDRLLDDLFKLSAERQRTLILVTHDPRLAERCRRTVQL